MRPLILTAIAAGALVAGVAIAQPAPPPGGAGDNPPPPPPREMDGPGGWRHGPGRHMPPPPPPSRAAFFQLQKGDASVTVKCAENESTKACTDAAAAMLQAVAANPAR